jgi:hypothetical protein
VAHLAEAKAAWERANVEAQRAQAAAVKNLLASGLQPDEVVDLLGTSNRELRSLRATLPPPPTKASGPMNRSVIDPINASVALELKACTSDG